MAGVEAHAQAAHHFTRRADLVELGEHRRRLGVASGGVEGVGVGAGVDLARARADARGGLDLRGLGVDEHAGDDAGVGEAGDHVLQARLLREHVEPALGGDLVAALGHQHRHLRLRAAGDGDHLVGGRHLEVELDLGELGEPAHVLVADVAAVLAQVDGDAVGTTEVGFHGGPHPGSQVRRAWRSVATWSMLTPSSIIRLLQF